jgi:hypothetical protein
MRKTPQILAIAFYMMACNSDENLNTAVPEGTNLRVNSYTVSCTGEMEASCLLIQEGGAIGSDEWSYFYYENSIEGFDYSAGFIYNLEVTKTTIPNPIQDGPSVSYKLKRILSKEKQ